MRLREVIRTGKSDIVIGRWGTGHIPAAQFPLRDRPTTFKLGPTWRWAVIRFRALGQSFRVLLLLNVSREIFRAVLAAEVGKEFRMICVHEFHAREPGWHCHMVDVLDSAPQGWRRRGMRRFPKGARIDAVFDVTEITAVRIAQRLFRIDAPGDLL